jgi:phosphohistidine phosphatase SixA
MDLRTLVRTCCVSALLLSGLACGGDVSDMEAAAPSAADVATQEAALDPPLLNEREPNDSAASANVAADWILKVVGFVGTSTDRDWYQLRLAPGETLAVDMTGPWGKDYDLFLHNASLAVVASSTSSTSTERVTYRNAATTTATVYLRVIGYAGAFSTTSSYALNLTRTPAVAPPTTVYILRHAEKATTDWNTPLSSRGLARAQAWVGILAPRAPRALFTSNLQRTQQTLQPTASAVGRMLTVRPALSPSPWRPDVADSTALAQEILAQHRGATSIVCWHTPLVRDVAIALGVPAASVPVWSEDTFDHLWVVTIPASGPATLADTVPTFPPLP